MNEDFKRFKFQTKYNNIHYIVAVCLGFFFLQVIVYKYIGLNVTHIDVEAAEEGLTCFPVLW